ncbi:DUF4352 domain-containing protein [Paenibacillus lemnae]|uniref:DUF4352 domain-containing protein n=1 Tax=Paenibacillus lemnae TaxID=1330551 RepID=A0A848MDA0_PAELE|nr:DUF4352 domain-containing protein [Paenibacillus lemnae]NMO98120.1 DUF4352 domain-containing protein [Paenibacillus lemnae]
MKKGLKLGFAAILTVLMLSACSEQTVVKEEASPEVQDNMDSGAEEPTVVSADKASEDTTEDTPKEVVTAAKTGDTLNVDGVKITVVDINTFEGRINEYDPLQEDHAVKINVIVDNTTAESAFVDAMNFKLFDKDGFELNAALPGDEEALSSDIPAGKKTKGALYFDVPQQEGTWELHYESMMSIDGQPAVWEVEPK